MMRIWCLEVKINEPPLEVEIVLRANAPLRLELTL